MTARRVRTIVAGAATAGLTLLATPATADVEAVGTSASIRTDYGGAYFWDFGDKLSVSDYAADGRGVRAYLTWGENKRSVYAAGRNDSSEIDLEIKEGTPVLLQLCYTKGGKNVKCSATVKGRA